MCGFSFVNSYSVTGITVANTMPTLPNRLGAVGTENATGEIVIQRIVLGDRYRHKA